MPQNPSTRGLRTVLSSKLKDAELKKALQEEIDDFKGDDTDVDTTIEITPPNYNQDGSGN